MKTCSFLLFYRLRKHIKPGKYSRQSNIQLKNVLPKQFNVQWKMFSESGLFLWLFILEILMNLVSHVNALFDCRFESDNATDSRIIETVVLYALN